MNTRGRRLYQKMGMCYTLNGRRCKYRVTSQEIRQMNSLLTTTPGMIEFFKTGADYHNAPNGRVQILLDGPLCTSCFPSFRILHHAVLFFALFSSWVYKHHRIDLVSEHKRARRDIANAILSLNPKTIQF